MCGNTPQPGCLTSDTNVRLHSCERGSMCEVASKPATVLIQPIITHLSPEEDLAEVGVGGGGEDLKQGAELDLDQASLNVLLNLARSSSATSTDMPDMLREGLEQLVSAGNNIPLDWDADTLSTHSVKEVVTMLVKKLRKNSKNQKSVHEEVLPKKICFPYSRHSSLPELCHFIEAFQPKDVWPCTVNTAEWLRKGITIGSLFGRFCSGMDFEHDRVMQALAAKHALDSQNQQHTSQTTVNSDLAPSLSIHEPQDSQERRPGNVEPRFVSPLLGTQASGYQEETTFGPEQPGDVNALSESVSVRKTSDTHVAQPGVFPQDLDTASEEFAGNVSDNRPHASSTRKRDFSNVSQDVPRDGYRKANNTLGRSRDLRISENYSLACQEAYWQMIRNQHGDTPWTPLQLISTSSE
ncbi:hypothetical protein EDB82DRAFT_307277 [Fusarium venenatum]|uniref:uncharacterized protein n=1 Tax=Fusarium venenatum TaxID=56646 RepID=UPI001DAA2EDF|nr:hypothetical protein EDB82DRAFT_307277 [Fusarium venenatum]